MLGLVAEALCDDALALALEPVAEAVLCADLRPCRTGHIAVNARNGQAALYDALRAALLDDLGVDQLDHLLRVLVDVEEHDDAAQDANLRGGKADTARVFQRLAHIVDQYMQAVVELFDRTAVLCQLFVALGKNFAKCHDYLSSKFSFSV